MTAGPGEVVLQGLAALFVGKVDNTERNVQRSLRAPFVRNEAELGIHGQVRHERIHGLGDIQGREPHLVGGHSLALHARHRNVDFRHALPALVAGGNEATLGNVILGSLVQHLSQRERQQADTRGFGLRAGQDATRRRRGCDVGGAETDQLIRARLEEARTRVGRKVVGVRHAQDFSRFRGGEGLQTNAVGQVRIQALELAGLQAL